MWEGKDVSKIFEINRFFSAFEDIYESDFSFFGEAHNFWELLYIIRGNVVVSADDRVYSLKQGDVIFHKPMEFHKFHGDGKEKFHVFVMSFNCENEQMKAFENSVLHLTEEQKKYMNDLLCFARSNKKNTLGYDGYMECFSKDLYFSQTFSNLVELFLISCVKDLKKISTEINTSKTQIYKTAVRILENNVTNNISIPELAKKCNVSVSYLKNIFSEFTGGGVHKFFLNQKITHACSLLEKGMSVGEVADILSYSGQNYFSLVFKREMGISPTEYKKRIRG